MALQSNNPFRNSTMLPTTPPAAITRTPSETTTLAADLTPTSTPKKLSSDHTDLEAGCQRKSMQLDMWPARRQQEKERLCKKRMWMWIKIGIAVVIVVGALALGLGITKAVGDARRKQQ